MRKTLLVGVVLGLAAVVVVVLSGLFDLELDSTVLLGTALGAVVALVPDRTPYQRLGGFAAGLAVAWVGYLVRAAVLPDSTSGRAVGVLLVVALCVAFAAVSFGRLPLWSTLLGAAALTGAYEETYAAAPPEVLDTSVSTVTALVLTVAFGFLAVAIAGPDDGHEDPADPAPVGGADDFHEPLAPRMETSK